MNEFDYLSYQKLLFYYKFQAFYLFHFRSFVIILLQLPPKNRKLIALNISVKVNIKKFIYKIKFLSSEDKISEKKREGVFVK